MVAGAGAGCSLVKVQNIPTVYDEEFPAGEVVREIMVLGNKHTRTSVIARTLATQVGDTLTVESILKNREWLDRLGVFTSIRFLTLKQPDGLVLFVQVTEATPYLPSLSMELTEENGFSIGPALSAINFAGTATKVTGFARFGGATNLQLRVEAPWRPRRRWTYSADMYWRDRTNKLDDFHEESGEVYLVAYRQVWEALRAGTRLDFLSIGADTTGITLSRSNRDNIVGLSAFAEYDTRDVWANPKRGWHAELALGYNRGIINTPASYVRADLDLRRYIPLPLTARHSLAFYSLLTLMSGGVGFDIPLHQDFHIGGTNTVRGWELGAREGKHQFLNTLEYRFDVIQPKIVQAWFFSTTVGVQLAGLVDVGTAWDTSTEFGDNFIAGYGAGIRLVMPSLGLLRFDFARGQAEIGVRFHIGGSEKAEASRYRVR